MGDRHPMLFSNRVGSSHSTFALAKLLRLQVEFNLMHLQFVQQRLGVRCRRR